MIYISCLYRNLAGSHIYDITHNTVPQYPSSFIIPLKSQELSLALALYSLFQAPSPPGNEERDERRERA